MLWFQPKAHPKQAVLEIPQMSKSIYLQNKYTKTYYQIIDRAKSRPKPSEYTEKHHTIPVSITKYLGLPESEKVILTFEEHWTCHHLLMKMVEGILKAKMYYAFTRMGHTNGNQDKIINSKMYGRIKIANLDAISGKNSPLFGKKRKPFTTEHKKHISESAKNRPPITEKQRKLLSEAAKRQTGKIKGPYKPWSKKAHKNQSVAQKKRRLKENENYFNLFSIS